MDATIAQLISQQRLPELWNKNDSAAREAWKKVTRLTASDRASMSALGSRQQRLFDMVTAAEGLCLDARATAPFTTGLGNEHPLENGFAFLNPYGLPYLPGSGVKGGLRQAARELASGDWGDAAGWRPDDDKPFSVVIQKKVVALSMCDVLFGPVASGSDSDHVRGALSFWDVIPRIAGDSLLVEIMTPHQSHYYQQKPERKSGDSVTPHDSGQPTPISFLTVPPGSDFSFHVICDRAHLGRLAPALLENDADGKPQWQRLLTAAFEHAFEWLGFGAKTAVGYGAMTRDRQAEQRRERERIEHEARQQAELAAQREAREHAEALERMSPIERSIAEFLDQRPDKNQPELSAVIGAVKQGRWQGEDKIAVARWLEARMREAKGQWKESSQAKKPEKDKDYQNTLLVKAWLGGK
ncbi:MAG: type III-B CRISPR module RAMP protein Cmr6 [Immundisolibacter sp.]|uniref:type III-B CRISPR module RAMP protein Cmr6 n=1 Tax=Immundisolibacter sp. TaxID=1934948 RepID=UPI0019963B23|nr:type III-B CRISPR module RAMP protein Cmr6 [Immundisolibacter sp.]MBC7162685.1 type III-B CRISPR module RAMP protein Cmr6 [Immundisolibacter sp.]